MVQQNVPATALIRFEAPVAQAPEVGLRRELLLRLDYGFGFSEKAIGAVSGEKDRGSSHGSQSDNDARRKRGRASESGQLENPGRSTAGAADARTDTRYGRRFGFLFSIFRHLPPEPLKIRESNLNYIANAQARQLNLR